MRFFLQLAKPSSNPRPHLQNKKPTTRDGEVQGRTGRIVVAYCLGTLGSGNFLLCGVKRCENDYQPFSLSFQIRTVEPKGSIGSNPRLAPPKERKNGIPNGIPFFFGGAGRI